MITTQGPLCTGIWKLSPAWWQIYRHQCLLSSMVAHLDSVTSLAVDQHGLYLISGSHDCSIRWLALDKKRIIVNFGKDPLVLIALTQAVESWKQDVRAGDNRSQEKVWRKHFRRRFPSFETIHCQVLSFQQKPFHLDPIFLQRWRRCSCESVHLNSWIQDSRPSSEDHQNIYYDIIYRFKSSSARQCILCF